MVRSRPKAGVSNHEAETTGLACKISEIARTLPDQRHAVKEYIQERERKLLH
jgi:hypothetical protein